MAKEITIFSTKRTLGVEDRKLIGAVDRIAPLALQAVAGNESDTQKIRTVIHDVKDQIGKGGRESAVLYLIGLQQGM